MHAARLNSFVNPPAYELRELLRSVRRVAVVGCSPKPYRMSHQIAASMQRRGYVMVPVHPAGGQILGMSAFTDLSEIPDDYGIDMVNVFRRPEATAHLAHEAARLGARVIWLQHGIANAACARAAQQHGLVCVMNACWAVTYAMVT
jgi:predicted CoA-binding protein